MSTQEADLRKLLLHLYDARPSRQTTEEFSTRQIIVTPFNGAYGTAGFVIAVNGSPPRGIVVSLETRRYQYVPPPIFYISQDRSKRLGSAQAETVRRYLHSVCDI